MVTLLGETFPRPFSGGELAVVECAADEAVGAALAQGRALCMERSLFEAASLPANFIMEDGRMRLNIDLRGQRAMPPEVDVEAHAPVLHDEVGWQRSGLKQAALHAQRAPLRERGADGLVRRALHDRELAARERSRKGLAEERHHLRQALHGERPGEAEAALARIVLLYDDGL
eukprot:TRINITY_DN13849_c0_g1_i1.p1 TRINITY_DN13849_c0_g1~~TRINITY_DN13849_c0_g1_i1.p1  ORF type:complete len:173 (+),score=44.37 TRINITY_DN13849_c0_g1_i1:596-1114(+)